MQISPKALVQYKKAPAKVISVDDKIEIELMSGATKRVRDKDVLAIHPGPLSDFSFMKQLVDIDQETIEETSTLLDDETCTLIDLGELIFPEQTPANLWSLWKLVEDDSYFSGSPNKISTNDIRHAQEKIAEAAEKAEKKSQEKAFYQRLQDKKPEPEDLKKVTDIEELAFGIRDKSALFGRIGEKQNPQNAHRYLCDITYWPPYFNPYPQRQRLSIKDPETETPLLPEISRKDLRHLSCFAIDDEGNTDPDDAISIEGDKIWIHVADVAALAPHDAPLDQLAQEQSGNLYIPETTVHMLPRAVTDTLGLGLQSPSPALSIGLTLDSNLEPTDIEIHQSIINVERISYKDAEDKKIQEPFATFYSIAQSLKEKRASNNAIQLQFPEVKVSVNDDNKVHIQNLIPYESRNVVMEFMLLAGAACGTFAITHELPFIFSTQPPPKVEEYDPVPQTFAQMMALRRTLSRSTPSEVVESHSGLGLPVYTQVTSPLRRYTDLSNHQQLCRYIQGEAPLSTEQIKEKILMHNRSSGALRKAERESNLHWKCVYLLQNKGWQGEAHITTLEERKVQVIIPELALETKLKLQSDDVLDQVITLQVTGVDLSTLEIRFKRL